MMRFLDRVPVPPLLARTLYYLAILVGLLLLSSRDLFTTPGFVYQAF